MLGSGWKPGITGLLYCWEAVLLVKWILLHRSKLVASIVQKIYIRENRIAIYGLPGSLI